MPSVKGVIPESRRISTDRPPKIFPINTRKTHSKARLLTEYYETRVQSTYKGSTVFANLTGTKKKS